MRKKSGLLLLLIMLMGMLTVQTRAQTTPPVIVLFESELQAIPFTEAESGQRTTQLNWVTYGMDADHQLMLYAYEISTWVLLTDPNAPDYEPLEPNGSIIIPVRQPLNFNPPTYRLVIYDASGVIVSESTVMIPYTETDVAPSLVSFSTSMASISASDLYYQQVKIPVSWEIADRTPTTHLLFEQMLPDGEAIAVDFPRANVWVSSTGQGVVGAVYREGIDQVVLRLRIVDLPTGRTLDEAAAVIPVTGTVATPTPQPTGAPAPTQIPAETGGSTGNNPVPPPVTYAGAGSGFELGGHVAHMGSSDVMRSAGMTWVKKQIRWHRGDGTGAAAAAINEARTHGFKILLGIVGYSNQMVDFEQYTSEFAAYLGQVAALNPDAIEVWNEPNIDREWLHGNINGSTYTIMLASAFNAIKSVNSGVMVISGAPAPTGFFGGCTATGCDDAVFLRQMANAGAASYMDCIGAHYNEGIISPDQQSGDPRGAHYTRYFQGMLNTYYGAFGGARPVCWTELGYLTGEGFGAIPAGFAWASNTTLAQHAEWLGRAAALSRASGKVRLMIVWNINFTTYTDDPQAGYAIIRPDGSCPACSALAGAMQ